MLQKEKAVDYKDRIRNHKMRIFTRSALAVLLVAAVLFLFVLQWKSKVYTECVTVSSSPVTIVQGASVKALGSHILLYSKDGASCLDNSGGVLWNQTFEMQNPMTAVCGSTAAIGDYNGRTIYVVNEEKQLGTISTNLPIRALCASENGVVAAVLDDSDVTRILLYDGNETTDTSIVDIKATMKNSGYPLSISLSPNGKLLAISYLHVDSGEMKSSVAFFNFGDVGQNESDNYVSGYDYIDTIVPYVQFMSSNAAFAVSDDRIAFYAGSEKPSNTASVLLDEEVQGIYYNESYVGLVYMDQSGEAAYRLDVYNTSGNLVHSLLFDTEYTDIVFYKDQVMIYNDMDCRICSVSGADKFDGTFEKPVSLVVPASSAYKYTAVTSSSVDYLELK